MRTLNGKTEARVLRNGHWVRIPMNPVLTYRILVKMGKTETQNIPIHRIS